MRDEVGSRLIHQRVLLGRTPGTLEPLDRFTVLIPWITSGSMDPFGDKKSFGGFEFLSLMTSCLPFGTDEG